MDIEKNNISGGDREETYEAPIGLLLVEQSAAGEAPVHVSVRAVLPRRQTLQLGIYNTTSHVQFTTLAYTEQHA